MPLPVESVLPALIEAVRERRTALLRAPTGAGKTTRVPPALLDAGLAGDGAVVVLEPRRIAARAAARRMAEERGVELGGEVGYQVRFDRRAGKRTRILVVTEGLLVRMLQEDPFLERVGAVVLDEFHERHLDTDLALAMLQRVRADARPDLALVVMSATFEAERLAAWLGDAPIVESEGRLFPVDVRWAPRRAEVRLEESVARGVADVLERTDGDVLVFLPGVGEIKRAREALEPEARRRGLELRELYGDLAPEEQDATLAPGARRRVVLATNVAESSVTVPGVTAIVDTGLVRRMRFDPAVGLDRLELGRISRASADQRAGRAGRTAPGVCLRLWSELDHRALSASEEPELRRVDLAGTVLQLRAWGEPDAAEFPWFEPPAERELARAAELLELLGALEGGRVTREGRRMARLPVHPRLARLLLEGRAAGRTREAALMAALLSERDPFRPGRGRGPGETGRARGTRNTRRSAQHWSDSDVVDRLQALEGRGGGDLPAPDRGAAHFVRRAAAQLERIGERGSRGAGAQVDTDDDDELRRWLFAAFPDRLARRRAPGERRAVMVGGRGVRLADESAVAEAELFVCVELDAGKGEALVRQASAVEREWLAPEQLAVEEELGYDAGADRVRAVRRTLWRDLVLEETSVLPDDPRELERVLSEAAAAAPDRALNLAAPEVAGFLARVRSLAEWRPELELPTFGCEQLEAVTAQLVTGARSFADLRRRDPLPFLSALLTREQARALEREAPERIRVPSGSAIRLVYEPGRPPVLAARIQELFGLEETPRVAGGRVKVLMHLLAPNRRPQQVTDDLASFWSTTYADVRKELRRRYPKHSWPENPREGVAERRPRRPPRPR